MDKAKIYPGIFLSGLGIGWLMGLSVSPVASIVIASVVGIAASLVAALSGLPSYVEEKIKTTKFPLVALSPWPVFVLLFGIIIGSSGGIYARNNSWLGSDLTSEIKKWKQAELRKSSEEIANRMFDFQYPISNTLSSPSLGAPAFGPTVLQSPTAGTMLFAATAEQCKNLSVAIAQYKQTNNAADMLAEIQGTAGSVQRLPGLVKDPDLVVQIIEQVICSEAKP